MELSVIHTAVLESMNEAVYVCDNERNLLYVNPASEKLTGWPAEEAMEKKCYEVFGDETQKCRDFCPVKKAMSQGRYILHHEGELKTRAGELRHMQVSISPIYDSRVVIGATVVMGDITRLRVVEQTNQKSLITLEKEIEERKRAVNALLNRERLLKIVSKTSTRFINIVSEKIDDEIIYTLAQIGRFVGVDRSYVFLFTEKKTKINNTHEWCENDIEPQIDELKGIDVDQELPWFSKKIKKHEVLHIPNVAKLPTAAQAEKEHFKAQNIQSLVVVPMVCEGELLGFVGFDSVRKEAVWSEDIIDLLRLIGEIFANAIARRSAEDQKQVLQYQLQQAQKMEAIGTLAGGIAHDFNNLLSVIQGTVSLMLCDTGEFHPYYENYKAIEQQVQRASQLTSQLLGYARKGRYHVKPIDLNRLVRRVAETFGRTRKDITVKTDLTHDLCVIKADQGQIEQTLLNIFINSADAMSDGGLLILATRAVLEQDMTGKPYTPQSGKYALLTIEDTGEGMDSETQERIFDPFFTTKEVGKGTGLGMASAYGIIKGHGGYIEVDSQKGRGTICSIYLPMTEEEIAETVSPDEEIAQERGTVLVVDDEEMVLNAGVKLLEKLGYTVLAAKTGKEAIDIYIERNNQIDLVILDMILPEMDGGEIFNQLRKIDPGAKVLLSSGYSINRKAKEILDRGCVGFLQKPFTKEKLSRSVQDCIRRDGQ